MKISSGLKDDGIVVGNTYDKYGSKNPIVRAIMHGYDKALSELVDKVMPKTIHEIGCGEGFWVLKWNHNGIEAIGSDFSSKVIGLASENAKVQGLSESIFKVRSVYDVDKEYDAADLIVCCEVLEHLEQPKEALKALQDIVSNYIILSVPREPIWCALNLARGKYITDFGNTPGHIQHWSRRKFINLISQYFDIVELKSPFPWTMLLCKACK